MTPYQKALRRLLKNDGSTYAAIGAATGLSRQRVQQIAARHGITRRQPLGVLEVKCIHCGKPTPAVPTIPAR